MFQSKRMEPLLRRIRLAIAQGVSHIGGADVTQLIHELEVLGYQDEAQALRRLPASDLVNQYSAGEVDRFLRQYLPEADDISIDVPKPAKSDEGKQTEPESNKPQVHAAKATGKKAEPPAPPAPKING